MAWHRPATVSGLVLEERNQIAALHKKSPITALRTLYRNIVPQSVSLVLYHTNEKTTRCPFLSLFPGNQHICTASQRTREGYNPCDRHLSCRCFAIPGQGLRRMHPRPHGISGLGCPSRPR